MRKLILVPLLAAFLLVAPGAIAATKTVTITNSDFVPNSTSIETGDTLTFQNTDNRNRQPVSQDVPFASPVLRPGESWTTPAFTKEGRFVVTDALVRNQRVTVTVTKPAPPTSPTLNASRLQVIYGGAVVLKGKAPTARAGQKLTLRTETLTPAGTRQASTVSETTTTSDGSFQFTHVPTALTTYTALLQTTPVTTSSSPAVTVAVAPRVAIGVVRKLSGRRVVLTTKATSAVSYAGKSAYVQRRDRLGRWISIKRVVLLGGSVSTQTTVRLPTGLSRVRVLLPKSQAGVGYVAGISRTLAILR